MEFPSQYDPLKVDLAGIVDEYVKTRQQVFEIRNSENWLIIINHLKPYLEAAVKEKNREDDFTSLLGSLQRQIRGRMNELVPNIMAEMGDKIRSNLFQTIDLNKKLVSMESAVNGYGKQTQELFLEKLTEATVLNLCKPDMHFKELIDHFRGSPIVN